MSKFGGSIWGERPKPIIKKEMLCSLCKSKNTRKDFDFPKTMRCCENCGCDYIVDEKTQEFVEVVFNPKTDI